MKRLVLILIILVFLFPTLLSTAGANDEIKAPDFTATDVNGIKFNLSDYSGKVIILHVTGLENPLCVECFEEMKGQIVELVKLSNSNPNVTVITINIRKYPSSDTGFVMAERDCGVNVSWNWVEDFSPYPIAGLYQKYWTIDGAFSNPSIILIDTNQSIVGVRHVYCMGKGVIDGIQTAESLEGYAKAIADGTWE
jgi:cytochrome c-type biogenesis protein